MKLRPHIIAAATAFLAVPVASTARANPPAVCATVPSGVVFPDAQPRTLGPADLAKALAAGLSDAETLGARLDGDGAVVVSERAAVVRTAKGPVEIRLIDAMAPAARNLSESSYFWYTEGVDTLTVESQVSGTDLLVITIHRKIVDAMGETSAHADTTHLVDPKTGAIEAAWRCVATDGPRTTASWTRDGNIWRVHACGQDIELPAKTVTTCRTKNNTGLGLVRGWVKKAAAQIAKGDSAGLTAAIATLTVAAEIVAPTAATVGDIADLWVNLAEAQGLAAVNKLPVADAMQAEIAFFNARSATQNAELLQKAAMGAATARMMAASIDPGSADDIVSSSPADLALELEQAIALFEIARGYGAPAFIVDEFITVGRDRIKALKSMVEAP